MILNKWDLVEGPEAKAEVRERIQDRSDLCWLRHLFWLFQALSGKNVHRILGRQLIRHLIIIAKPFLHPVLMPGCKRLGDFGHTISKGKAILKMKYVTQTGTCPPQFTFFCNHPDIIEPSYERYRGEPFAFCL